MQQYPHKLIPGIDPSPSGITIFHPQALPLFRHARGRARLSGLLAGLIGGSRRLRTLSKVSAWGMLTPTGPAHVQQVRLHQIVGTVDGGDGFDVDFYPRSDRLADRWVRIASMMLQGRSLPPVELVQVDKRFFVIDGPHRISVARMLGYDSIDAVITAHHAVS